eukprot:1617633-Pleurochrysis_carterae.AAC.1
MHVGWDQGRSNRRAGSGAVGAVGSSSGAAGAAGVLIKITQTANEAAIASAAGAAGCGGGCDGATCERPSAPLEAGCFILDTPDDATLVIGSNMPVLKATPSQRGSEHARAGDRSLRRRSQGHNTPEGRFSPRAPDHGALVR